MSEDHSHGHSHVHGEDGKSIKLAFFLNLGFTLVEIVGGFLTGSIAIVSDAVHDAGDCISLGLAWYLQKVSQRRRDEYFSYGYKRFSLLGAVIISVILIVSSAFVIRESVLRFMEPRTPDAGGMLILAIIGFAVNGFAALRLKRGKGLNQRAVFLHMMEDVLGWAAVLVASVVMIFVDAPFLDPLLSIGISLWVLWNVYGNIRGSFKVLLQGTPAEVDVKALEDGIAALDGVASIHDVHVWSLDGESNIVTMHLVVDHNGDSATVRRVKNEVRGLCDRYGISHATIETEAPGEECSYGSCPY